MSQEFIATGRRKTSVASVRLTPGTGELVVNGRPFEEYFKTTILQSHAIRPLEVANVMKTFDIKCKTTGGGVSGQAGAMRHAIARALLEHNPELRPALKAEKLLTRDPRMKERKKPGQPGARKRFQFSKR
jgi:small subunit ribosomal protein S9